LALRHKFGPHPTPVSISDSNHNIPPLIPKAVYPSCNAKYV
jgi:hypothetical protein